MLYKIKFSLNHVIIKNEFRILLLNPYWKGQNLSIVEVLKICSSNYKLWFPYIFWPFTIHTKCFYLMVLEEKSIIGE